MLKWLRIFRKNKDVQQEDRELEFPEIMVFNTLPKIRTARNIRDINMAIEDGYNVHIEEVKPNSRIMHQVGLAKNKETGRYMEFFDRRSFAIPEGYESEWVFTYYQYKFPRPYAAYILPKTLQPGDVVWLSDIIEDIPGNIGPQSVVQRAERGPAIWTGEKMVVNEKYVKRNRQWRIG